MPLVGGVGLGVGGKLTGKEQEGAFWGDRNVLYLDPGDVYMGLLYLSKFSGLLLIFMHFIIY